MSTPVEAPDRRPLLYGVFALVILVAAAYLFWPRSPQPDSLVLTPESVRSQASATTTPIDPSDDLGSTAVDDEAAHAAATKTVGDEGPVAETRIIEDETPARNTPVRSVPKQEVRTQTSSSTSENAANSIFAPGSTGRWVLNVGAFSNRENAQKRAQELTAKGLTSHVYDVAQEGGKTVYRVRIGYFESDSRAKSYGEWLQRTHGISSWPSQR